MFNFRRKPRKILESWDGYKKLLKEANVLLFLDFDGTISPIVDHPSKAELLPEIKSLLHLLSQEESVVLTIVTGRAMKDIREKVGMRNVIYVANHGFDMEGPQVRFRHPFFPKTAEIYRDIEKKLRSFFRDIPEVFFEDKGIVLSVHYRRVPEKKKDFVKRVISRTVKPYVKTREVVLRSGKEVLEIRPAIAWNKGTAVLWLLRSLQKVSNHRSVSIYIGDDETDEDAFKALRGIAFTIRVGEAKASLAQYYLKDIDQVRDLLSRVAELKRK